MRKRSTRDGERTVGLDVGDRQSCCRVPDGAGHVEGEGKVATTREGLRRQFGKWQGVRIAPEVGTHSTWVSRLLEELGHEVAASPRRLRSGNRVPCEPEEAREKQEGYQNEEMPYALDWSERIEKLRRDVAQ